MTSVSSGTTLRAPLQSDLFGLDTVTDPTTSAICPTCGTTLAVVSSGSGPHWAALRCTHGHYLKWIPKPEGFMQ